MPKDQPHGYLSAIDPMTGKAKWQMPWPGQPSMAGTLSTGGGLVFTGAATGEFMAVDASNGKKLYEFNTGSGIIGLPVTWEHKGQAVRDHPVRRGAGCGRCWETSAWRPPRRVARSGRSA